MSKKVFIELDTQRELRYGVNVFVKIENALGVALPTLDTNNMSFGQIRTILYIALKEQDKDLTPELVGNMIDKVGIEYCTKKIGEAINSALQTSEDEKNLNTVV